MEALVREDGKCLVFGEVPSVDAYDAREAQHDADILKARTVAQQLRRRAERLVAHARRLEEFAAEGAPWKSDQNAPDPGELLECLLDPSPEVVMVKDAQGGLHYLDLVEIAYCNADIEDPEIVQEYIGSSAEVTARVREEIALVNEAYANWTRWLEERG